MSVPKGPVWACCVSAIGPACQHIAGRQADSLPKRLYLVPPSQDIGQQGNARHGDADGRERAAAMRRHPAGKGRQGE